MATASNGTGTERRTGQLDALCGLVADAARLQQAGRFDHAVAKWTRDLCSPADVILLVEQARRELRASRRRDEVLERVALVGVTAVGERLVREALTDPLTGLATRARMDDEVQHMHHLMGVQRRYGHPFAILLVDIDGLKRINDERGHAAGDAAIAEVGRAIREHLRKTDRAFRWGGDEFLLVMSTGPEDASLVVERIQQTCATSTSYGVASHTGGADAVGVAEWLSAADADLYRRRGIARGTALIPAQRRRHLHPARQVALGGLAAAAAVTVGWTGLTNVALGTHGGSPATAAATTREIAPVASAPQPVAVPVVRTTVRSAVRAVTRTTPRRTTTTPAVGTPAVATPQLPAIEVPDVVTPVLGPVTGPLPEQPSVVTIEPSTESTSLVPSLLHTVKGVLGALA
jgi:diguanylate cyclase (GGDEF)-like protein